MTHPSQSTGLGFSPAPAGGRDDTSSESILDSPPKATTEVSTVIGASTMSSGTRVCAAARPRAPPWAPKLPALPAVHRLDEDSSGDEERPQSKSRKQSKEPPATGSPGLSGGKGSQGSQIDSTAKESVEPLRVADADYSTVPDDDDTVMQ